MRASAPREPITVSPSWKAPRSTRATDSLPPWPVCRVFITCASGGPLVGDAEAGARLRAASAPRGGAP